MLYEFLAVNIHQQNIREGVVRQQKRDLVKAFRRAARTARRSEVRTTIEPQAVEHPVATSVQRAGW